MASKVFVEVDAVFKLDGTVIPKTITWENGQIYEIDRILDVRQAASLKAGGQGKRYTCRIQNQQTFLFYEEPYWFVERKNR